MDSSQQALQTNGKLFFKFRIRSRNFGQKTKNIQINRGVNVGSNCNVLHINGFVLTNSTN